MNCEFTEKVSSLIDGELSAEESESIRMHIAGCASCEAAREDFLLLRREIKDSAFIYVPGKGARQAEKLRNVFIFGRKTTLPAPVFGALLLTLFVLSGWTLELSEGWTLSVGERAGDYVVKKLEIIINFE